MSVDALDQNNFSLLANQHCLLRYIHVDKWFVVLTVAVAEGFAKGKRCRNKVPTLVTAKILSGRELTLLLLSQAPLCRWLE